MFGRRVIYSDVDEVTADNVCEVLEDALAIHTLNRGEIEYLYNYYKGDQPIWKRKKEVRSEIKNIVVENRANEIVSFKTGYQVGEPIQYVSRSSDEGVNRDVATFNEYIFSEDKAAKDKELCDWFFTCGTSYRMTMPYKGENLFQSPFSIFTLDPRDTFVVYSSALGNKQLMSCKYVHKKRANMTIYSVYTDKWYFEIIDGTKVVAAIPHTMGENPITEYPANNARLGAFEIVIPILNCINNVASNRIDAIEQFVNALMVFKGVDINSEDFEKLKDLGGIKVDPEGDIKYIVQELNQMQTQALIDYMYQTVLSICGMPNRNGGTSTSDTGKAVILRDGWSSAEARAKDTETVFKLSEKKFLSVAINICNILRGTHLKPSDIEARFTRRNHENITEKSQVLISMLNCPDIDPKLAFEYCGMFVDPERAYMMSKKYKEEQEKIQMDKLKSFNQSLIDGEKQKVNDSEGGAEDV